MQSAKRAALAQRACITCKTGTQEPDLVWLLQEAFEDARRGQVLLHLLCARQLVGD